MIVARNGQSRRCRLLRQPGRDHARIGAVGVGQALHGGEIALEIAAGDAEAGCEIGVRRRCGGRASAPARFPTSRAPIASHNSAKRIADRDRRHEAAIDRDLGQLGAFVAHGQDRATECSSTARKRGSAARAGSAQPTMVALRLASPARRRGRRPAFRPDSKGAAAAAGAERPGEARRHLRQHDHDRVGIDRRRQRSPISAVNPETSLRPWSSVGTSGAT